MHTYICVYVYVLYITYAYVRICYYIYSSSHLIGYSTTALVVVVVVLMVVFGGPGDGFLVVVVVACHFY